MADLDVTIDPPEVVQAGLSVSLEAELVYNVPVPPGDPSYLWTQVGGPQIVAFSAPTGSETDVTFPAFIGEYTIRVTVTHGALSGQADATIWIVTAGDDQFVPWRSEAELHARPVDDDLGFFEWSKVSGPGTVTFEDATSPDTFASFSEMGTYVLRADFHDNSDPVEGFDTLTIEVALPTLQPMRRLRVAPHIHNENKRLFFSSFELSLEPGLGATSGQGSDPQVMLRWSNDGGKTWSNVRSLSAGELGQYLTRAVWHKLGAARDRVFEVSVSDPVAWRILGALIDLRSGDS